MCLLTSPPRGGQASTCFHLAVHPSSCVCPSPRHTHTSTMAMFDVMVLVLMLLLHLLLFFTAYCHCSDAYAPLPMTSIRHHRWSSSSRLLFSTAEASRADVASSPSGSTTAIKAESSTSTTTLTTPITPTTISEENITTRDLLSLDYIRSTLIRQEETIIFALIERAQFRLNDIVYKVGGVPGLGVPPVSSSSNSLLKSADGDDEEEQQEELSFLDFMFIGTVRPINYQYSTSFLQLPTHAKYEYYCSHPSL